MKETSTGDSSAYREIIKFSELLDDAGVPEAKFEASVVRGLDYYTGIVFEVMDTGGSNRRAICGGGRYDNLVSIFGGQKVSGVGFGLGILTLQLFLQTYGLIPESIMTRHPADIFLAVYSDTERPFAVNLAERLRDEGVAVEIDVAGKNLSKQFGTAGRKSISLIMVIGPQEIESGNVTIKNLVTGTEVKCEISEVSRMIGEGIFQQGAN